MTAKAATWVPCPTPGCTAFPYPTQADLDEHLATCTPGEAPLEPITVAGVSVDAPQHGTGSGSGSTHSAPSAPAATDKQLDYLASLLARLAGSAGPETFRAGLVDITKDAASKAIEAALAALEQEAATAAAAAPTTTAPVRANKYAAKCAACGVMVAAEAGALTNEAGKWVTRHVGACPTGTAAAPVADRAEPPEGFHRLDGQVYSVKLAVHGSGLPVARRLCLEGLEAMQAAREAYLASGQTGKAPTMDWDYVGRKGAFWQLSPATLLSKEEAQELGSLYGFCCRCGKCLTEPVSIGRGMGPVCFGKTDGWA